MTFMLDGQGLFFFQAEDGIRDDLVTGVQTCALPICSIGCVSGDGNRDIVTANGTDGTVSVLLGDGQGGFGAKADHLAQPGAATVAVGDVNGDEYPDLVVPGQTGTTVSVLINNGTGNYADGLNYGNLSNPVDAVVADLNGDGLPDIAVANGTQKRVTVLQGDGTGVFGGFGKFTNIPAPGYPQSLALADLNHDGAYDLVAPTNFVDGVSSFLAKGWGEYGTKTTFRTGVSPSQVVLRDLNADGKLDAV